MNADKYRLKTKKLSALIGVDLRPSGPSVPQTLDPLFRFELCDERPSLLRPVLSHLNLKRHIARQCRKRPDAGCRSESLPVEEVWNPGVLQNAARQPQFQGIFAFEYCLKLKFIRHTAS